LYCRPISKSNVKDFARVDSAIYENPDGTKTTYFVFEDNFLKNNVSLSIFKKPKELLISATNVTNLTLVG
jgi:hypothetical protein